MTISMDFPTGRQNQLVSDVREWTFIVTGQNASLFKEWRGRGWVGVGGGGT